MERKDCWALPIPRDRAGLTTLSSIGTGKHFCVGFHLRKAPASDFPAQCHQAVHMFLDTPRGRIRWHQVFQEGMEQHHQLFSRRQPITSMADCTDPGNSASTHAGAWRRCVYFW